MKRVLTIDGGGVKGFAPAVMLAAIEAQTGRPICETFDLVVGTSVGAILGALVCVGNHSALAILNEMEQIIPVMFTRRVWPLMPKYSRAAFIDKWHELGNDIINMADCRTNFMCTSVNVCDGRTHFFKSWEQKDGALPLITPVLRSFAAPIYFGEIVDKSERSVWLDGGTGGENSPLLAALVECVRQGWFEREPVHVLSLGCGSAKHCIEYERAKNMKWLRQAMFFISPKDGGLARNQSIDMQVRYAKMLDQFIDGYTLQRIDQIIPEKYDKLDGKEYIDFYITLGTSLAKQIDYANL